jgi:hypothetical protein
MRVNSYSKQPKPCSSAGGICLEACKVVNAWPTARLTESQRWALVRAQLIKPPGA